MSLTWHIVRKDIARLWWVILLWVVALAGEMAFASIQSTLDAEGHALFYLAAWTFGNVFIPVIGYGLVMGLQEDDPVTEGDSFWMTRPITGSRLISAKALLLCLFCLVPVAVCLPFWLSQDFTLESLFQSSALVFWRQLLISLLAIPFAVISSSGAKFVTYTLVGAVALLGLYLLFHMVVGNGPSAVPDAVLVSRGWMILAVWVVAAGAAALNQYYRRGTRTSVAFIVGATSICFVISVWWVRDISAGHVAISASAPAPVLVEVSAHEGAHVSRGGSTLRILSVIPDFSRTVVVEVSESEPDASRPYPGSLSSGPEPAHAEEHYLLVSREDGRAMTAEVTRNPEELHAERVRFFRSKLVFNPQSDLAGHVPANMAPWVEGAALIKVEGRDAALFKIGTASTPKAGVP